MVAEGSVSEESRMNVKCYFTRSHTAVLFCETCEANLCKMCSDKFHSFEFLKNHKLSWSPRVKQQLIYCPSHPSEVAEFVCTDDICSKTNEPTCKVCYQSGQHKGHNFKNLEEEYEEIQTNIENCYKEIHEKKKLCKEYRDKYDSFISTYRCIETSFFKSERNKTMRNLPPSKKDDNPKIKTLQLFKNEYKMEIEEWKMNKYITERVDETDKAKMIKHGPFVEFMLRKLQRRVEAPVGLVMPKSFNLIYPAIEPVEINLRKAVYFPNYNSEYVLSHRERGIRYIDKKVNGKLVKFEASHPSILCLDEEPNDATVDLSLYRYNAVIYCSWSDEKKNCNKFKKLMRKKWWDKIVVIIDDIYHKTETNFEKRMRKKAETDQRLEIVNGDSKEILKKLIEV